MSDTDRSVIAAKGTGEGNRYRLHRAGIHNVWQYDDHVFRFADGRLLLRGRNGAGKSKALEMLLPFLLDGDEHRLDTTGNRRTGLRWLMIDGRHGATTTDEDAPRSTLGYLWVELTSRDADGTRRWRTLGAAIGAHPGERETTTLFFVTDRRVGTELPLVDHGTPLPIERVRHLVGEDNCYDRATSYRARVMRDLFGLDDPTRYRNLLHLLYRLRRPTIGERIESGELGTVLAETLPPMDDTVLDTVARNLSDLDAARGHLAALRTAHDHVTDFLSGYRRYVRGVLRTRVGEVRAQLDAHDARADEATRLAERLDTLITEESTAQQEYEQVRRTRDTAAADDGTLAATAGDTDRPAAPRATDEESQQTVIEAHIRAARAACAAAEHARAAEAGAEEQITADVTVIVHQLRSLHSANTLLRSATTEAGLPHRHEIPDADPSMLAPRESVSQVDIEGWEHAVERDPVTGIDTATVRRSLARLYDELTATSAAVENRNQAAVELHDHCRELAAAEARAAGRADEAEWLDGRLEQAVRREREAVASARAAGTDFAAAVRAWAGRVRQASPQQASHRALPSLEEYAEISLDTEFDPVLPEDVARRAEEVVVSALAELRDRRDTTVGEQRELTAELHELAERRGQADDSAELERRIAIAEALLAEAGERRGELEEAQTHLTRLLREVPSGTGLVAAWAISDTARVARAELEQEAAVAGQAAESAREAVLALRRKVLDFAEEHTLPAGADELAATLAALGDARAHLSGMYRELDTLATQLDRYRADVASWERLRSARIVAEDARATAIQDMITVRRDIELSARAGSAASEQIAAARGEVQERMDGAEQRLPELRRAAQRARDERVAAEASSEAAARERAEQVRRLLATGTRLVEILGDPEPDVELAATARLGDLSEAPDGPLRVYLATFPDHADPTADPDDTPAGAAGGTDERVAALRALTERLETDLADGAADTGDDTGAERPDDSTVLRWHDELRHQLGAAGTGVRVELTEPVGLKRVLVHDGDGTCDITRYAERLLEDITAAEETALLREEEAYERHLLGELATHLGRQITEARILVASMNDVLRDVTTSQGLGVRIDWQLASDADEDLTDVVPLLERPAAERSRLETTRLRDALRRSIEAIRQLDPSAGQGAQLRAALDYRSWFAFHVHVTDAQQSERRLTHRTALSQGEQRVVAYLVLFAAAAAQFDTLARSAPHAPRFILLDDAFAKVDEPTHGRLLGLLVALDLDFVLTSERLWGCFPEVPSLHIYECLRDPAVPGIATLHFTWNGERRRLQGV